ncbi:hypothetical protein [Marinoscillum sp. MHG1-6]|uniref:hypothetical protein n=1 Tax=Marinoscillum sp. MHG1-6 TaxID=2959627 RepID=UPI00215795F3|nr:hypothetical protein [Marinoscillum sp. MHG1-6]
MKFILALACLILQFPILAQNGNSIELDTQLKGKHPLASGKVSFEITGDASGTATLYFDRNGWREVLIKEITIVRFGMTSTEKTIELVDGDFYYQVNLDSKKGSRAKQKAWSQLMGYKDRAYVINAIMEEQGAVRSSDTTHLEYPVTVWEFSKGSTTSIWSWQGITLRQAKSLPGLSYEMVSVKLEENCEIPEEVFALPEDIAWED